MNIFPTSNEKLITSVIIAFFLGAVLAACLIDSSMVLKDYIATLVTLAAAFSGAYYAFKLNHDRELTDRLEADRAAINFAMFTLIRQLNAITICRREIEKYPAGWERSFNMPAMKNAEYSDLKQNFTSLSFILETDQSHLLLELSVEQERFEQAMESIQIRNNHYVNSLQPVLSDKGLNQRPMKKSEWREELGELVFEGCIQGEKVMTFHVVECESSIPEMLDKLLNFAKKEFKGQRFIHWSPSA